MTSKEVVLNNLEKLLTMAKKWDDPWEKPLHEVYREVPCFSPVPSLSMHCANINSIYGLPPTLNWQKIWKENATAKLRRKHISDQINYNGNLIQQNPKSGFSMHAGFGLGLERIVQVIASLDNIQEAIAYPRTTERLKP